MSETDENLITSVGHEQIDAGIVAADFARRIERERDEAREALADWENAADHVEANHPDEVHCGCVPVLRKLLADARKERDEARAAAKWESFDAMERAGAEQARRADENREWALRAERERDEAREALENHTASTTHTCHSECKRPMCVLRRELDKERERAKELAELVDGSYIFVELHKPDCEYNKKWRVAWMEKAKRLIPGVDSIWY